MEIRRNTNRVGEVWGGGGTDDSATVFRVYGNTAADEGTYSVRVRHPY